MPSSRADLPPSGHQRVNLGFLAPGSSPRRAQMKTQEAASAATCARASQIRRGLSPITDGKTKRNRRNPDVSDPVLLHVCRITPVVAPPNPPSKCPGHPADLRLKAAFGVNDNSQTWTRFRHVHVHTRGRLEWHLRGRREISRICKHARSARRIKYSRDNSACRAARGDTTPFVRRARERGSEGG